MPYEMPPPPAYYLHVVRAVPSFASILPKSKPKPSPYSKLICTEEDKKIVYEIISTMANNNVLKLGLKASYLGKLGEKISHLHPLKFLSAIFTQPDLKLCMQDIYYSSFKRNGIMDKVGASLSSQMAEGVLMQYFSDFCKEIQAEEEELKPYFESQEWVEMVRYLSYR